MPHQENKLNQLRDRKERAKDDELIKLIVVAQFPGNDGRIDTLKFKTIDALKTYQWDGYRIESIKLYCELKTKAEFDIIIEFLEIHKQCCHNPFEYD